MLLWFGNVKVHQVGSLVALEVVLQVDLHGEVEVSLAPLFTTERLHAPDGVKVHAQGGT